MEIQFTTRVNSKELHVYLIDHVHLHVNTVYFPSKPDEHISYKVHNYFTIKEQNKKKPFVSCRRGSCKKANLGLQCEIGLRTRTFHILSGSVLSVWSKVESVLAGMPGGSTSKMQIIRLKTDCGQRIVGKLYMYISVS